MDVLDNYSETEQDKPVKRKKHGGKAQKALHEETESMQDMQQRLLEIAASGLKESCKAATSKDKTKKVVVLGSDCSGIGSDFLALSMHDFEVPHACAFCVHM